MIYVDNDSTYSQRIYIPRNDDFDGATGHTITLQSKDYTINQNGLTRIHPDAGFDGISGGTIGVYVSAATGVTFENLDVTENGRYVATGDTAYTGVTVNVTEGYDEGYHDGFEAGYSSGYTEGSANGFNSGYTSGMTDGFASGYTSGSTDGYASGMTDGYSSGYTEGFEAGYSSGYTDGYATGSTEGYSSGVTDGRNEQKALLTSATFTKNGTYTCENGWNSVSVDLALGNTSISIDSNTTYILTPPPGFEGFKKVTIITDVTGSTPAVLTGLTATTNNQTYTPPSGVNGFNSVEVAVPMIGINTGISSDGEYTFLPGDYGNYEGFTGVTITFDTSTAFNSGYTSGSTEGYSSGITYQKSLLASTSFTENGTYTSENGWSSVTVNANYNLQNYGVTVHSNYMPGLINTFTAHATATTNSVQDTEYIDFTLTDDSGRLVTLYKPGFLMNIAFEVPSGYSVPSQVSGFTWWNKGWKIDVTSNVSNLSELSKFTATTTNGVSAGYDTKYATYQASINKEITSGTWISFHRNPQSITYNNDMWVFEYANNDTVAIKSLSLNTFFFNDTDLQTLTFPESVNSLGDATNAFCNGCTSLESVYAPNCRYVGTFAFAGCKALTSVTLSDNLYQIDNGAFTVCTNLESIDTSKVQVLSENCFSRSKITSLDLSSVHIYAKRSQPYQDKEGWLAPQTCYYCDYLTGVTIGSAITDIAGSCFFYCESLCDITCLATTAPTLRTEGSSPTYYPFTNVSSTGVLRVPTGSDYSSWLSILGTGWTISYI